ncbi:MAG: DUF2064 domain-containing protein [bacterium]|nr:DUF2064 domain-containing protein [bacterium]
MIVADTKTPTLLVLTRGPRPESRRKRLLPGRLAHVETEFHQQSLAETIRCGRQLGCRIVVSCPRGLDLPEDVRLVPQAGRTFGERFAGALEHARAIGSGPVLVVGTDTPGLGTRVLKESLARLEAEPDSVVLGPAIDGGFYLLAFNGALDGIDWERVSWCSGRTRATLRARIEAVGRKVRFLEPRADLDRAPDMERWLASGRGEERWRIQAARIIRLLAERLLLELPAPFLPFDAPIPATVSGRAPPR